MGPKDEKDKTEGVRFHARESVTQERGYEWFFEERAVTMMSTQMILVRVLLAKIENKDKLVQILRQIPIRQGQEGWNCVFWVKEALENLERSKGVVGTSVIEWESVRDAALSYCQRKKDQHRFDGKGDFDMSRVATFDLTQEKEIVP